MKCSNTRLPKKLHCTRPTYWFERPSGNSRWKSVFRPLGLICALGMITPATQAQVPGVVTQVFDNFDLKHYATSQLPFQDQFAMAGTIFDLNGNPGDHVPHLLLFDQASNTTLSRHYDDPGYAERTVGVHYDSPDDIIMVTTHTPQSGTNGINGIQIIHVDGSGDVKPANTKILTIGNGIDLFPMSSAMEPGSNRLYICGFLTYNLQQWAEPSFSTGKFAFLLQYDLSSNTVALIQRYDWAGSGPNDYDIAHRIKILSNNRIWLGGMCSSYGPGGIAMMNMTVDPSTLNMVANSPIRITAPLANAFRVVSSYDYWQDPTNPTYGYVFGNYGQSGLSSLEMLPNYANITSVNSSTLQPSAGMNHAMMNHVDYEWGNNLVQGNSNNSVILSGFQYGSFCAGLNNLASPDNVNPFLTEIYPTTSASGNLNITTGYWSIIGSIMGTGTFSDPNSCWGLGGPMSSMQWGPVTTVRDDQTSDIILNAPVWNPNAGKLNMKFIRANSMGNPNCEINYCTPSYGYMQLTAPFNAFREERFYINEQNHGPDVIDVQPDNLIECASNPSFYKKDLKRVQTTVTGVTISPNPANDYIQLNFNGTINPADNIKVQIYDVSGKVNNTLFEGTYSNMQARIVLPKLAFGVYMIRVQHNGNQLKSVPLVLQ